MTFQPSLGAEGHCTNLMADGSVIDVDEKKNSCRRYFYRAANNPGSKRLIKRL